MDKEKINRWHAILLIIISISWLIQGVCSLAGTELSHGLRMALSVGRVAVAMGLICTSMLKIKHKF